MSASFSPVLLPSVSGEAVRGLRHIADRFIGTCRPEVTSRKLKSAKQIATDSPRPDQTPTRRQPEFASGHVAVVPFALGVACNSVRGFGTDSAASRSPSLLLLPHFLALSEMQPTEMI